MHDIALNLVWEQGGHCHPRKLHGDSAVISWEHQDDLVSISYIIKTVIEGIFLFLISFLPAITLAA